MPIDKPKHPDKYPESFRSALRISFNTARYSPTGEGESYCDSYPSQQEALSAARKFRAFRKGILRYPLHGLWPILQAGDVRTKVAESPWGGSWNLITQFTFKGGQKGELARQLEAKFGPDGQLVSPIPETTS